MFIYNADFARVVMTTICEPNTFSFLQPTIITIITIQSNFHPPSHNHTTDPFTQPIIQKLSKLRHLQANAADNKSLLLHVFLFIIIFLPSSCLISLCLNPSCTNRRVIFICNKTIVQRDWNMRLGALLTPNKEEKLSCGSKVILVSRPSLSLPRSTSVVQGEHGHSYLPPSHLPSLG